MTEIISEKATNCNAKYSNVTGEKKKTAIIKYFHSLYFETSMNICKGIASEDTTNIYFPIIFPEEIKTATILDIDNALNNSDLKDLIRLKLVYGIENGKMYYNYQTVKCNKPITNVDRDYFKEFNLSQKQQDLYIEHKTQLNFYVFFTV